MKILKRFLLFLLHTGCTIGVQLFFLSVLLHLGEESMVRKILPAVALCLLDLAASCFLLRGNDLGRVPNLILSFWDLLLVSPLFLVAAVSLLSGAEGAAFGTAVLLTDLLLILQRSTTYVLFDPARNNGAASHTKPAA